MYIHKQPLVKWRISQREREYLMGIVISHLFYYKKIEYKQPFGNTQTRYLEL